MNALLGEVMQVKAELQRQAQPVQAAQADLDLSPVVAEIQAVRQVLVAEMRGGKAEPDLSPVVAEIQALRREVDLSPAIAEIRSSKADFGEVRAQLQALRDAPQAGLEQIARQVDRLASDLDALPKEIQKSREAPWVGARGGLRWTRSWTPRQTSSMHLKARVPRQSPPGTSSCPWTWRTTQRLASASRASPPRAALAASAWRPPGGGWPAAELFGVRVCRRGRDGHGRPLGEDRLQTARRGSVGAALTASSAHSEEEAPGCACDPTETVGIRRNLLSLTRILTRSALKARLTASKRVRLHAKGGPRPRERWTRGAK
ncbi:unnamed protein product, partial [Prorocentrum cordatum]